ncbi:hypothetical protein COCON_G00059100 [Conger conger]|uniref:trypsin n=1 Tax=Conger conger TaxID=82655 RepID=A0A9Q1DR64_CONCO|nr:hypothetical protein COCON_G00059100 [Conger conger]
MAAVPLFLLTTLLPLLVLTAQQDSSIVNGREAKPHSRPYMVSVQQNKRHICGGFLVSDSFVMTAAHCLTWGQNLTVLLGAHDISENQKSNRAEVKFYHIHPGFEADALENDIMLLQLKTAVKKTKEVQWIPLPKKDKDVKPKTVCSVAGWGANKTKGYASPRLLEVNVTVMNRKTCIKDWVPEPITSRMICGALNIDNKGACQHQQDHSALPDTMAAVPLFLLTTLLPLLVLTAQQDSSIVNGREAKPHSRPYMVSVQQNKRHKCGGFLVSDSFVMTAAHCLTWGQNLTVLLGAHDISENQKSNRAEVKFYHIHPGFEADALENDIMLLQLKTAVKKTKEVQWIPLPKKDKDVKPKTVCSVAGWGANKTNGM